MVKKKPEKIKRSNTFIRFITVRLVAAMKWSSLPVKIAITFFGIILFNKYFFSDVDTNHDVILRYLEVLKWPILAAAVYLLFRSELPELLKRIVAVGRDGVILSPHGSYQPSQSEADEEIKEVTDDPKYDLSNADDRQVILRNPTIALALERIHRIIFGSQIEALKRLASYDEGLNSAALQEFYELHKRLMTGTTNKNVIDLLSYPASVSLLTYSPDTDTFRISGNGRLFLDYLDSQDLLNPVLKPY